MVDTPVELRFPDTFPVTSPDKLPSNVVAVMIPASAVIPVPTLSVVMVDTPDTFSCCPVKLVTVVTPSVEMPLIFKFPLAVTLPLVTPNPVEVSGLLPTCSSKAVELVPIPRFDVVVSPVAPAMNPSVEMATTA